MRIDNFTDMPEFSFRSFGNGFLICACVLKKTYEISQNGILIEKDQQPGPNLVDEYYGDPKCSSLRQVHDRVPFKPKGEIYFIEPISRPPDSNMIEWPVSIQVGSIFQELRVCGPRSYRKSIFGTWGLTEPSVSDSVHIRFENTFGGGYSDDPAKLSDMNPVGKGYALERASGTLVPAPQIANSKSQVPKYPLAITPLHRAWSPRRQLAGTFDESWKAEGLPLYPQDFDFHFYQQAPDRLQLSNGYFRGDEQVKIDGIGKATNYKFNLNKPDEYVLLVDDDSGDLLRTRFNLDTLIFDLENSEVSMVWRAAVMTEAERLSGAIFNQRDLDE